MRFGLILDGGTQPGRPQDTAFKELLARAALAHRWGFHSLWTGPGYLTQGWHPTVVLAPVAAVASGMELGMVSLLFNGATAQSLTHAHRGLSCGNSVRPTSHPALARASSLAR